MSPRYTPATLLRACQQLFRTMLEHLDPGIAAQLKCRRAVTRHGTRSSVLVWNIWDRRQTQATLPPGFLGWWVNYDPDHFETDRTDWLLTLHMNTVRIYHNTLDVRQYLERHIPPVVPHDFDWVVHPRQLRVAYPFDFSGPPSGLPQVLLAPLTQLVSATHPVLDRLIQAFGPGLDPAMRAAFIASRKSPRAPAARDTHLAGRSACSHGIPARLRHEVLARHGHRCAICGQPIRPEDRLHVDHIKPFAQGGLTTVENLQPTHAGCNLAKGSAKHLPPELRSPTRRRPRGKGQ